MAVSNDNTNPEVGVTCLRVATGPGRSASIMKTPTCALLTLFRLTTIYWFLLISLSAEEAVKLVQDEDNGAIQLVYEKPFILKQEGETYALHLTLQAEGQADAIAYSVYRLNAAGAFVPLRKGKTDEGDEGSGSVNVGPFRLEWSQRNLESGWLYLGTVSYTHLTLPTTPYV